MTDSSGVEIEIGIDEAGRGPVLGPLVYGCAWWPVHCADEMKAKLGLKDSKQTTVEERTAMFHELMKLQSETMGCGTQTVLPEKLSNEMLAEAGDNLNTMSYNASAELLISVLKKGFKVKRILLDQLGPTQKHLYEIRHRCRQFLSSDTEIVSESKADDRYPVVSAASIVAKVTRDNLLENWEFVETKIGGKPISHDFGCGYPGDVLSKQWLRDELDPVFGFPQLVRFSWSTSKNLLDGDQVSANWHEKNPNQPDKKQKTLSFKKVEFERGQNSEFAKKIQAQRSVQL